MITIRVIDLVIIVVSSLGLAVLAGICHRKLIRTEAKLKELLLTKPLPPNSNNYGKSYTIGNNAFIRLIKSFNKLSKHYSKNCSQNRTSKESTNSTPNIHEGKLITGENHLSTKKEENHQGSSTIPQPEGQGPTGSARGYLQSVAGQCWGDSRS